MRSHDDLFRYKLMCNTVHICHNCKSLFIDDKILRYVGEILLPVIEHGGV